MSIEYIKKVMFDIGTIMQLRRFVMVPYELFDSNIRIQQTYTIPPCRVIIVKFANISVMLRGVCPVMMGSFIAGILQLQPVRHVVGYTNERNIAQTALCKQNISRHVYLL